jgi:hypothetical protein
MLTRTVQSTDALVANIKGHHRKRRYAMKVQQTIDRRIESFIRCNLTDWHPTQSEAMRAKYNKEALAILAAARKGQGSEELVEMVEITDASRSGFDRIRDGHEAAMQKLALDLPVSGWRKQPENKGFGALGLATILAETGPLHYYSGPAKVWKRLGYAPYQGLAGSSWKRKSWRPRALTDEEWKANPFSGARYALISQVGQWLWVKQWVSKAKNGGEVGRPNGPYGEIYAARRAKTAMLHPEWTPKHSHDDALRIMTKELLKNLWKAWTAMPGFEPRQREDLLS